MCGYWGCSLPFIRIVHCRAFWGKKSTHTDVGAYPHGRRAGSFVRMSVEEKILLGLT